MSTRDYVDVTYDESHHPFTMYPQQLAAHLVDRYQIPKGARLLDVGCGRGEFLKGFISCGLSGAGVDQSPAAKRLLPDADIRVSDATDGSLPFEDNSFDVVYSKSVVEHFYYPEKLIADMWRVLEPGGLLITMTPDWDTIYRMFYEDFTHRTPFTVSSLTDIQVVQGFSDVEVEKFRQLPSLWNRRKGLRFLAAEATRFCAPRSLKPHSKWVRFSKELMLLSSARKPSAVE